MSRIPGGSPTFRAPVSDAERSHSAEQPVPSSTNRAGLSRADAYSRTGSTEVVLSHSSVGSFRSGRVTTSEPLGASAGAVVQLDPMAMLGNLHTGDINLELPLDRELINHPLVNVRPDAKAKVRWAVQDGKIDFRNSRVQIEGVSAVGVLQVRGAYLDDSGQLRLDMMGPDLNITRAAIGDKRIPRSMEKFSEAVKKHHMSERRGAGLGGAESMERFEGLRFDAKGVALRPDRALSLGEGNTINFDPKTRVDVVGDLSRVEVSGRAAINGVALKSGETEVNLGKGDVELHASAEYGQDGLEAELSLDKLNLDVNRISHSLSDGRGIDLDNAHVRGGQIRAKVHASGGQPSIPYLHTRGEFSAESMTYDDGSRHLEGGNVRLDLDAESSLTERGIGLGEVQIQNLSGDVHRLNVTDENGKTMTLEEAHVDGASLQRIRKEDGTFRHDGAVDYFKGTVEGDFHSEGLGVSGTTSFERTTATGSFRMDGGQINANVDVIGGTGRARATLDESKVSLGELGEVTIAAGTQADFTLASSTIGRTLREGRMEASGQLKGRLESGHLKLGGAGRIDLKDAAVDLSLRHIDKREGELLPRFEGDLKLTVDSDIHLEDRVLERAGVTSIVDAEGKVSLDLEGASLRGDGQFEVQRAGVELEASVGEIRGQVRVPGLAASEEGSTYTVKAGDTLSRIAAEHDSTVNEISQLNQIADPNHISVGQVLQMPGTAGPATGEEAQGLLQATTSGVEVPKPAASLDALRPNVSEPLSFDPLEIAGRVHNGTVEMEVPLNEEGVENSFRVLGVRTLDLQPDTKIQARLVVEDGKVNFEKSEFRFNKDPSALGLVDIHPQVTADGQIRVGALGQSINITNWVTGSERLPSRMSSLAEAVVPKSWQSASGARSTTSSADIVGEALEQGRQYVDLGEISIKAEGVSLASGRLDIGDNDFLELGVDNRVNIAGNSQSLSISGEVEAQDAFVDVGGAVMDLGEGKVAFDASIQTGLSRAGQLEGSSTVDVSFRIPEARVDHLQLTQPDGNQVALRDGSIQDTSLTMSHRFQRDESGELSRVEDASKTSLTVGSFSGEVFDTSLAMRNEDGTPGSLEVVSASGSGSLSVGEDGRVQTRINIDDMDARLNDLNLELGVSSLTGLDGGLTGSGTLSFDSQAGLDLEGNFRADAKVEDGRLALNSLTDLDIARNSRAAIYLTRLNTTEGAPIVRGDVSIDAALDSGILTLPDGQDLRFESGSKLQLSTHLGQDQDGARAKMTGTIQANLGRQSFHHNSSSAVVSGELHDGTARVDLGEITLHEDGRYRILNPNVKVNMDLNLLGRQG